MDDTDLPGAETQAVGARIREELARRRLSRQALADLARISLSTLEKALAGTRPFTLASTLRLEDALGTRLRDAVAPLATSAMPSLAPDSMGAYARAAVRWLEGRFLALRPSFGTPGHVYAYAVAIRWIDAAGHLGFAESQRLDAQFEQRGYVALPNLSGHIYLVTIEQGQHRLMVLGRPTIDGTLYGVLTTLQVGHGSQLVPVACPVALTPLADDAEPVTGRVGPGDAAFEHYRAMLAEATAGDFARFHL